MDKHQIAIVTALIILICHSLNSHSVFSPFFQFEQVLEMLDAPLISVKNKAQKDPPPTHTHTLKYKK